MQKYARSTIYIVRRGHAQLLIVFDELIPNVGVRATMNFKSVIGYVHMTLLQHSSSCAVNVVSGYFNVQSVLEKRPGAFSYWSHDIDVVRCISGDSLAGTDTSRNDLTALQS
jgi:hypothetical protein